jgi:hypothetical protein
MRAIAASSSSADSVLANRVSMMGRGVTTCVDTNQTTKGAFTSFAGWRKKLRITMEGT